MCRLASRYATSPRTQRAMLLMKFIVLYWRNPNYSERAEGGVVEAV